jgi:sporulation protein YlmC with PRC-barrel domain
MKKTTVSLITIMTALALSSPLYAASDNQEPTSTNPTAVIEPGATDQSKEVGQFILHARSARDLLGMDIVSQNGEDIGQIQDLKIDTDTGRINYVSIQKGGVLGIGGEKDIAVPIEAFSFTEDNAQLLVDQSKLESAPMQSNRDDAQFRRDLESHYGVSPSWQGKQDHSSPQMNMNESNEPPRKGDTMNMDTNPNMGDPTRQQTNPQ